MLHGLREIELLNANPGSADGVNGGSDQKNWRTNPSAPEHRQGMRGGKRVRPVIIRSLRVAKKRK